MATSGKGYGGYDCFFVPEPPDVYTCLICTLVAKDCQQMDCCGRVFCMQCLAKNKKRSKKCPNCRKNGNSFNDMRGDREIKALKVKCGNVDNGCQWIGELRSLKKHVNTCRYSLIPCTLHCMGDDGKIVKVLKNDLANHLTNECTRRLYQCPHCEEIGEHKEMTTLHMDSCPTVNVQCPNTLCQDNMLRSDVSTHRSLCDYEKMTCKFSEIGCQLRPFRKSLKDHEEDCKPHFLLITANSLVLKKQIQEVQAKNNELEKRSHDQSKHIQMLEERSYDQGHHIQTLEKRLMIMSSNHPLTFRMQDYTRLKNEHKDFNSPPFYCAGYRFCVSIFAGGKGAGSGTHLSVYTYLMKGENDETLTWPFTGSVTIVLLNQLEDKMHHGVTLEFKADNICSQRVRYGEIGQAYGNQKFILIKRLGVVINRMVDPMICCLYLHQDTLVFRVSNIKDVTR